MSTITVKFRAYNRHGHIEAVPKEVNFYDYEIRDNPIDSGTRVLIKRLGNGQPKKVLFENRFGSVPITFKIKDETVDKIKQLKALAAEDSESRIIVHPCYTEFPNLSRTVLLPDDQVLDKLLIAGYLKGGEEVTVDFLEVEHEFPVSMLAVRNKDLDNTLSTSEGTPLYVTQIDTANNMIRLNWLPNIKSLFEPDSGYEWALLNLENIFPVAADPARTGDYTHYMKIVKHSTYSNAYMLNTKWLKYDDVLSGEATWNVNDRVMLYNPFAGKFDRTAFKNYMVKENALAAWRDTYVSAGPVFKHSDGDWVCLVSGYGSGGVGYRTGAFKGAALTEAGLTVQNSDNPVLVASGSPGWHYEQLFCSSMLEIPGTKHKQYIGFCSGYTGSKWKIGWAKFDEDFQSVTYATDEIISSSASSNGLIAPSVVQFRGQYWMAYIDRSSNANPESASPAWSVKIAKCSTIDGTYVYDHTICTGQLSNDGSWRSCYSDVVCLLIYKGQLYAVVGGTAWYMDSGFRGNRIYGLFKYNELTGVWDEDVRSPVLINPLYGDQIWSITDYADCNDHVGGYVNFYHDQYNELLYLFFSMNSGTNTYRVYVTSFDLGGL